MWLCTSPRFFLSMVSLGAPRVSPALFHLWTGVVLIHSQALKTLLGLAAFTGSQPQLAISGGITSFFGHLGLAWQSPIGCPLPWKQGWHGSAHRAGALAPAVASQPPPDCRSQTGWRARSRTVQATRGCGDRVFRARHTPPWEVNKANVMICGGMSPGIVSCGSRSPPRNSPVVAPSLALKAQLSHRPPCISPWQGGGSVCSLGQLGCTGRLPTLWGLPRHGTAS